MKSQSLFIRIFIKTLFFITRHGLKLRYSVKVTGLENIKGSKSKLILPNHQALVDPMLLMAYIHQKSKAVPVITSKFYDLSFAKWFFRGWRAVRVSDLQAGSKNTKVLDEIVNSVKGSLQQGNNIVIYPSGQLAGQGKERIFNKQSAHLIVEGMAEDMEVILVRIRGLWGSMWSRAWVGKTPDFLSTFIHAVFLIIANLIIFLPRRKVTIEFYNATKEVIEKAREGKFNFNEYLEKFYNENGEEEVLFLKHFFYGGKSKRKLPQKIEGSIADVEFQHKTDVGLISETVVTEIKKIVAEVLSCEFDKIRVDSNLTTELGGDSLNIVEIIEVVKKRFPNASNAEFSQLRTIADLCFMAGGKLTGYKELPPCFFNEEKPSKDYISINADQDILTQFVNTFSKDRKQMFAYDCMLGTTSRHSFLLKAFVIASVIEKKTNTRNIGILLPALQSTTLLIAATYIAGKVPVLLNWTVGNKVLSHCVDVAGLDVILSAKSFVDKISDQLPEEILQKVVYIEKEIPQIPLFKKLKGLLSAFFPNKFIPRLSMDDTAVILFTSGSESMPKAVPLTHRNIVNDLSSVFRSIKLEQNFVFLSFLPPFHSFGFTVLSIMPLMSGIKIVYSPDPTDSRELLRLIEHTKTNVILGTPTFLRMLLSQAAKNQLNTIRYAISGAESMHPSIKEMFDSMTKNALILEGYGITECSPILTINPIEKQKIKSVGQFVDGIKCKILDVETKQEVPEYKPGMIYVKGENVFSGYLGNAHEDPFEDIEGEKYYKTGDLGYMDEEGFLFITGRLKRFIKVAGEMISLPFIEEVLSSTYEKGEEKVLAIEGDDTSDTHRIVLFTKLKLSLEEVNQTLLSNGVAPISKVTEVIELEEIPMLGSGKVDYKSLKSKII